jgi:hypothetical protein
MKNYEAIKNEVEEQKQKIIEYFKQDNFDISFSELMKDLNISIEKIDFFEYCLSKTVEEGWVEKSPSIDHNEFDPGEKLDF